jgi:hypothetical protein
MTIARRASAFPTGASSANASVVIPAVTVGDLMLLFWFTANDGTNVAPTGWTFVDKAVGTTTTNQSIWLYKRIAISGDAGTTVGGGGAAGGNLGAATSQGMAIVAYYSDVGAVVTVDNTGDGNGVFVAPNVSISHTCAGVTVASVRNASTGTETWGTIPSGYTKIDNDFAAGGAGKAWCVAEKLTTSTTTENGGTFAPGGAGGTNAAAMTIALYEGNLPPVANAGTDQTGVAAAATVTLNGTGSSDPDGTVASYAWTQTSGPTVTLSSSTAASPTFTAPTRGSASTLVFSLVVTDNLGATSSPDTVSIGVLAGSITNPTIFSSATNSGTGTTPGITLPSLAVGDGIYLLLHVSGSVTLSTPPSGWTLVDGPRQAGSNTTQGWLYKKTAVSGDSGASVSMVISASTRWQVLAFVVRSGTLDQVSYGVGASTLTTVNNIPAFTPIADDCLAVVLMDMASGSGVGNMATTPPTGYTEVVDVSTTSGSLDSCVYLATKQLTGQAGTAQGTTTATTNVNHRSNAWVVTFAGVAGGNLPPTANAGTDQSGITAGATVTLNGSGSSDTDGTVVGYAWTQTSGIAVSLSDPTVVSPTFTAPSTVGGASLVFSLIVTDDLGATSAQDTVTITVGAAASLPAAWYNGVSTNGSGTTMSRNLPTGIISGDLMYALFTVGGNVTMTTAPSGWTLVDGPRQAGSNTDQGWLYKKTAGASESGTPVSAVISATARWSLLLLVMRHATEDSVTYGVAASTLVTTNNVAAYTPVANDCLTLFLMGMASSATAGAGMTTTPPTGYTERIDFPGLNSGASDVGHYAATKQLTGQAGTLQAADTTSCTTNVAHRANGWVLTFSGVIAGAAPAPLANAGADQSNVEPYGTVTLDGSGSAFYDPDTSLTYAWSQTSGTSVTLSSTTAATPTFTAPGTVAGTTLVFSLTVTGHASGTASTTPDTVSIVVLPATERAVRGGVEVARQLSSIGGS